MDISRVVEHVHYVMVTWIDSIGDDIVRDLCRSYAYMSGGCIPSLLLNQVVNDYDIFFKEDISNYLKKYYGRKENTIVTNNAITLKESKIQLVICQSGLPLNLTAKFDLVHCKGFYDYLEQYFFIPENTRFCIFNKKLEPSEGIHNEKKISTLGRIIKMVKRGWKIDPITLKRYLHDIAEQSPDQIDKGLSHIGYSILST